MKSNNPVFARSEEFNRTSVNSYGNQTYPGAGQAFPGYGEPPPDARRDSPPKVPRRDWGSTGETTP